MSLILDLSNEAYHADLSALSSSGLKLLLKDPAAFKLQYVDGIRPDDGGSKGHFEEGTLVHTLVLEPDLISEYAVYPGMRKAGAAWEAFKVENQNKKLISITQMLRAEKLYRAFEALDVATALVQNGMPEHNMRGVLQGVNVKARADYIVPGKYIVDVKTTRLPSDINLFKETVIDYGYHLSAALYAEIARQVYGVEHEFYWLVLSKEDNRCEVYRASEKTMLAGKLLVQSALSMYNRCKETGEWTTNKKLVDRSTATYEIEDV